MPRDSSSGRIAAGWARPDATRSSNCPSRSWSSDATRSSSRPENSRRLASCSKNSLVGPPDSPTHSRARSSPPAVRRTRPPSTRATSSNSSDSPAPLRANVRSVDSNTVSRLLASSSSSLRRRSTASLTARNGTPCSTSRSGIECSSHAAINSLGGSRCTSPSPSARPATPTLLRAATNDSAERGLTSALPSVQTSSWRRRCGRGSTCSVACTHETGRSTPPAGSTAGVIESAASSMRSPMVTRASSEISSIPILKLSFHTIKTRTCSESSGFKPPPIGEDHNE